MYLPDLPELRVITILAGALRQRLTRPHAEGDVGSNVVETVIITAFLATVALSFAATLGPKIKAKIDSINF